MSLSHSLSASGSFEEDIEPTSPAVIFYSNLIKLSEEKRIDFCKEYPKKHLRNLLNEPQQFDDVISAIPENDELIFIEYFGLKHIEKVILKITKSEQLSSILLSVLPNLELTQIPNFISSIDKTKHISSFLQSPYFIAELLDLLTSGEGKKSSFIYSNETLAKMDALIRAIGIEKLSASFRNAKNRNNSSSLGSILCRIFPQTIEELIREITIKVIHELIFKRNVKENWARNLTDLIFNQHFNVTIEAIGLDNIIRWIASRKPNGLKEVLSAFGGHDYKLLLIQTIAPKIWKLIVDARTLCNLVIPLLEPVEIKDEEIGNLVIPRLESGDDKDEEIGNVVIPQLESVEIKNEKIALAVMNAVLKYFPLITSSSFLHSLPQEGLPTTPELSAIQELPTELPATQELPATEELLNIDELPQNPKELCNVVLPLLASGDKKRALDILRDVQKFSPPTVSYSFLCSSQPLIEEPDTQPDTEELPVAAKKSPILLKRKLSSSNLGVPAKQSKKEDIKEEKYFWYENQSVLANLERLFSVEELQAIAGLKNCKMMVNNFIAVRQNSSDQIPNEELKILVKTFEEVLQKYIPSKSGSPKFFSRFEQAPERKTIIDFLTFVLEKLNRQLALHPAESSSLPVRLEP